MPPPFPLLLHLDAPAGAPAVRAEVQALGEVLAVDLAAGEAAIELSEAPRYLRLRLWCEEQVCGELLHLPDSVRGSELSLALEQGPVGWRVVEVDPGPAVPLLAQAALGASLVLAVGLLTLQRLRRGR